MDLPDYGGDLVKAVGSCTDIGALSKNQFLIHLLLMGVDLDITKRGNGWINNKVQINNLHNLDIDECLGVIPDFPERHLFNPEATFSESPVVILSHEAHGFYEIGSYPTGLFSQKQVLNKSYISLSDRMEKDRLLQSDFMTKGLKLLSGEEVHTLERINIIEIMGNNDTLEQKIEAMNFIIPDKETASRFNTMQENHTTKRSKKRQESGPHVSTGSQ